HMGNGAEVFTPTTQFDERLALGERWGNEGAWFSADGRLLAGFLARKEGDKWARTDALAVWELASGKVLARFAKARFVSQVAFAPGNRTVALLDGSGVRVADLLTGKPLAAYPAPDVLCGTRDRGSFTRNMVFAPDGRMVATGH